jgi:hypothetical protein
LVANLFAQLQELDLAGQLFRNFLRAFFGIKRCQDILLVRQRHIQGRGDHIDESQRIFDPLDRRP